MKILFENFALDSTITSQTASANYPPENLTHIFLRKRYQNAAGSDTLVFTFDQDHPVNSIYMGFHNADQEELLCEDGDELTTETGDTLYCSTAKVAYTLKNYSGQTLLSGELTTADQFEAVHFTEVPLVRSVSLVIDWQGLGGTGYLGGVGIGMSYSMPEFTSAWGDGLLDNTVSSSSLVGQVLQNYVEPMEERTFSWIGVDRMTYYEIKALIKAVGLSRPLWVDYFEDSSDEVLPGYAQISEGLSSASKDKQSYSFTLKFQEAR